MSLPEAYEKLFLEDYALSLVIGVYPHEQDAPQALRVSVELFLYPAHSAVAHADELDAVLDYMSLPQTLERVAEKAPVKLLETFAESVLAAFFEYPQVAAVALRMDKPDICPQAASVGYAVLRRRNELA